MQRRTFMNLLGVTGGGLLLGIHATGCSQINKKNMESLFDRDGIFQPNAFLSLHNDGRIVLAVSKSEMGQGIMTAAATLVAEELEVEISQIEVFQAYKAEFGFQMTGGSTSTRSIFTPIRKAAATAREMLRQAAAETWGVPIEECTVQEGNVLHVSSDKLNSAMLGRTTLE